MNGETINQLQAEIAEMRSVVLYYENRILRKQIAIEEIVQSAACRASTPIRIEPSNLVTKHDPADAPTVPNMIRSVLPQLDGGQIHYKELRRLVFARYPEHRQKLLRSFYGACQSLQKREGVPVVFPPACHGQKRNTHVNGFTGSDRVLTT
jgi:hypothetical protein